MVGRVRTRLVLSVQVLVPSSARGESRTLTGLPPGDFESPASAIPPLGPAGRLNLAPWPSHGTLAAPARKTSEPRVLCRMSQSERVADAILTEHARPSGART